MKWREGHFLSCWDSAGEMSAFAGVDVLTYTLPSVRCYIIVRSERNKPKLAALKSDLRSTGLTDLL